MSALRLASFKVNGTSSFGAFTGAGVVDFKRALDGKFGSLLELIRANATKEARAAAERPADYQLSEIEFLPPVLTPEKILCVGINYPERVAEYKDGREKPKYPNLF